ncbi:MAG TPA: hypothetical protein VE844_22135, partial [Gammaproteobacteria bacterium]|nr:hypothetical protein [Gammaproteobacteria bacterium]
ALRRNRTRGHCVVTGRDCAKRHDLLIDIVGMRRDARAAAFGLLFARRGTALPGAARLWAERGISRAFDGP